MKEWTGLVFITHDEGRTVSRCLIPNAQNAVYELQKATDRVWRFENELSEFHLIGEVDSISHLIVP